MSTHNNAVTRYCVANGTKLAYRRLGAETGTPLVMLMHFRGNMDFWDPALINALARSRPILLLDNAGIGKSEGEIPTNLRGWAAHVIELLAALRIPQIDLLGFSMGGGAAQFVALNAPFLVRKLILAGTRSSCTSQTLIGDRRIFFPLAKSTTEEDFRAAIALSFFNPSSHGQAAAKLSLERIFSRMQDRAPHLSTELAERQSEAFGKFDIQNDPYEHIFDLQIPVFIANGDNDLLIPTKNSVDLAARLPNAHLHIYPNSGHGFLYQYAELFARHVTLFLDGEDEVDESHTKTLKPKLA